MVDGLLGGSGRNFAEGLLLSMHVGGGVGFLNVVRVVLGALNCAYTHHML